MWKNTLALSALVLSVGITYRLIQSANADFTSSVSMGSNPIVNFGGVVSTTPITTAPIDQDIIITTIITNTDCSVQVNGNNIVTATAYFYPTYLYTRPTYASPTNSVFIAGTAKLKVPAGETFGLTGCTGAQYYIEGYYVHP